MKLFFTLFTILISLSCFSQVTSTIETRALFTNEVRFDALVEHYSTSIHREDVIIEEDGVLRTENPIDVQDGFTVDGRGVFIDEMRAPVHGILRSCDNDHRGNIMFLDTDKSFYGCNGTDWIKLNGI